MQHDNEAQTAASIAAAQHRSIANVLLVVAGGTVGTAAREVSSLAIPALGSIPAVILGINVVGAFVLGVLLEALLRSGTSPRAQRVRLLVGTGMLGGFTTYSALALDTATLIAKAELLIAALYAVGSVALGIAAAAAGIAVGAVIRGRGGGRS